jgi:hypothetical protein
LSYAFLADLVVAFHVAYVSFVIVGQIAILLGAALHWDWVRNRWFRAGHLLAIVFVALESIVGMACPLTVWEDRLRILAREDISESTFIGRWLHRLLFYDFDSWVFTVAYISFAVLVLATLWLVPPRWRSAAARGGTGPAVSAAASDRRA